MMEPVAISEVHDDYETATMSTTSTSSRSSISSLDSQNDYTTPLELGLVMDALQTSLIEQKEEEHVIVKVEQAAVIEAQGDNDEEEGEEEHKMKSTDIKVIMDYEMNHGVIHTKQKRSTTTHSANLIVLDPINPKTVKVNTLTPREQEKADEPILNAIHHLFNNEFMKAKKLFELKSNADPLHALGLGSMVFLKALMVSKIMFFFGMIYTRELTAITK